MKTMPQILMFCYALIILITQFCVQSMLFFPSFSNLGFTQIFYTLLITLFFFLFDDAETEYTCNSDRQCPQLFNYISKCVNGYCEHWESK